jgi:hypothetical protein
VIDVAHDVGSTRDSGLVGQAWNEINLLGKESSDFEDISQRMALGTSHLCELKQYNGPLAPLKIA